MKISNKNIFFLLILSSVSLLCFSNDMESKKIIKLNTNPNEIAKIYSFKSSPDNFNIISINISKPNKRALIKLKFVDEDDIYAIKIYNKDNKYLYSIGIGNPFYANYTHIGFEDREYMGGPVSSVDFEIALPLNLDPSSFVISRRNNVGIFNDIQEIKLN